MDDWDLMRALLRLDHVTDVRLEWSPALEVRVRLDGMDWDARAAAVVLIDDYAREHVQEVTVTARFDFPEPEKFTRHVPAVPASV